MTGGGGVPEPTQQPGRIDLLRAVQGVVDPDDSAAGSRDDTKPVERPDARGPRRRGLANISSPATAQTSETQTSETQTTEAPVVESDSGTDVALVEATKLPSIVDEAPVDASDSAQAVGDKMQEDVSSASPVQPQHAPPRSLDAPVEHPSTVSADVQGAALTEGLSGSVGVEGQVVQPVGPASNTIGQNEPKVLRPESTIGAHPTEAALARPEVPSATQNAESDPGMTSTKKRTSLSLPNDVVEALRQNKRATGVGVPGVLRVLAAELRDGDHDLAGFRAFVNDADLGPRTVYAVIIEHGPLETIAEAAKPLNGTTSALVSFLLATRFGLWDTQRAS